MIKQTYFTDQELVEMVKDPNGELCNGTSSYVLGELIKERLQQKTSMLNNIQERLNVAAEHMGHQLITDLIEHG